MNDSLNEQISALVDDELADSEQSLLLRQLGREKTLRQRLCRYQLASDALQDRLPGHIDTGFADRVSAAIEAEPAFAAGITRPGKPLGAVAKVAVAASVAIVAVFSLQTVRDTSTGMEAVATAPAVEDYIREAGQPAPTTPPAVAQSLSRNLDVYLVNHNEFAASRGMLPYVRLVGQSASVEKE